MGFFDSIEHGLSSGWSEVKHAGEWIVDSTEDFIGSGVHEAEHLIHGAEDLVSSGYHEVEDLVGSGVDFVSSGVSETVHSAEDFAVSTVSTIEQDLEELYSGSAHLIQEAVDNAPAAYQWTKSELGDLRESLTPGAGILASVDLVSFAIIGLTAFALLKL